MKRLGQLIDVARQREIERRRNQEEFERSYRPDPNPMFDSYGQYIGERR